MPEESNELISNEWHEPIEHKIDTRRGSYSVYEFPKHQIIEYHPAIASESLADRFSKLGIQYTIIATVMLVAIFYKVNADTYENWLMTPVRPLMNAAHLMLQASGFDGVSVATVLVAISLVIGLFVLWSAHPSPTKLGFSPAALWFLYEHDAYMALTKRFALLARLPWQNVKRVYIERVVEKGSRNQPYICFLSEKKSLTKVKIDHLTVHDEWPRLQALLRRSLPEEVIDPEVFKELDPQAKSQSFTELWLQELLAPSFRQQLAPLNDGQLLNGGAYSIEKKLGMGGQATVYLATVQTSSQTDLKRGSEVAIKEFILPLSEDREVRRREAQRFTDEAKLLSSLDHPKIVRLIDSFVEDHRAYLVLERASGTSIRDMVRSKGRFSEPEVRQLALQMCEILNYLHSQPKAVIHRDFSPDNLILDENGMIKLIDFSVADVESDSEQSAVAAGKQAYMPPEQFRGSATSQSDIYALGATMYFMLVGEDPEPITQLHPAKVSEAVSKELDSIVALATALAEDERFESARQVTDALLAGGEQAEKIKLNVSERELLS